LHNKVISVQVSGTAVNTYRHLQRNIW